MTQLLQKEAAKRFVDFWSGKGYEKGQSQPFWLSLLRDVFGVDEPEKFITFEDQVHLDNTSFIDGYIDSTHVMIEQKSLGKDLQKKIKQSNGAFLTPYEQAKRYSMELPYSKRPRWIVTSNFESFLIYDMERPGVEPQLIYLKDLPEDYWRLEFLVDDEKRRIQKEQDISEDAGKIIKLLYDALAECYGDMTDPVNQKSLNKLIVRLVFCLYAEDSEMFSHGQFQDYINHFDADDLSDALFNLFKVLDTREEDRRRGLKASLAAFPYTNGGLFHDKLDADDTEIPPLTEDVKRILTEDAAPFNWSAISPTIFGGIFESTLNPETRRKGGMHYTSIENIHKVIDPLFLNDLKVELDKALDIKVNSKRKESLQTFQDKIAGLRFLDPACGSGNFLTETYLSLRRLENKVIKALYGEGMLGLGSDLIKVSIQQFYGVEINDFAVSVATTALWISEAQMLRETESIIAQSLPALPLKTYTNIHEGNALRMDWNEVVPVTELNYIMGNPPFIGEALRSKEQSKDMADIFGSGNSETKLDYVLCWYKKAQPFIVGGVKTAFVSTNSICQGESVPAFWKNYLSSDIEISFAHRSFKWDSEASQKAAVWCVIVGLQCKRPDRKRLYDAGSLSLADHINPYLYPAPDIWIESRSNNNLCSMPKITKGSEPTDDGHLFLTLEEKEAIIKKCPTLEKYIRPFVGAKEYIHGQIGTYSRFCFWFVGANPKDFVSVTEVSDRLRAIKNFRLASSADRIRKKADYPYLFCQIRQPQSHYMIIPRHTSSERDYIPLGYLSGDVICGDANNMIPEATNYMFGVMESSVHMLWMKVVCGRLGMGYRYSPAVYNNFPWPNPTDTQRGKIDLTAQAILAARALYPDNSLADLYDGLGMPPELRKAHQANDAAVMEAYGFRKDMSEPEIVAELFRMYRKLTDTKG